MKKTSAFICVHLWLIFLSLAVFAQDFRTVRDGIEYAEMTKQIDNQPVKMNLLRLDLSKVRLDVVHAMDAAIGLEKTSSIAIRHAAFAAINAGFFRIDKSIWEGDDVSLLMIDRKLLSESENYRTTLLIDNKPAATETVIQRLNSNAYILPSKKIERLILSRGINRQRGEDDFVIYTSAFHRTTLTDNNGTEIIVRKNVVVQVFKGKGSNLIPDDGFVISLSGSFVNDLSSLCKIGKKLEYNGDGIFAANSNINDPKINGLEDAVSGVPQLIKNGVIEITWQEEKSSKSFVETKHPRTAVAKLKDGKFLMVTVDGRSEESGGIGLEDLAKILLELGATDAMNLDGGGSSTMFLDGKIVNHPSDKEGERKVGDAILVTLRK